MRKFFFAVALILMILAIYWFFSAPPVAIPEAKLGTMMENIYISVYQGTINSYATVVALAKWLWAFIWLVVLSIGFCVLESGWHENRYYNHDQVNYGANIALALVLAVASLFYIGGNLARDVPALADAQGISAMKDGYNRALDDQANQYVENLHTPPVATDYVTLTCDWREDSHTDCAPYEHTEIGRSDKTCTDIKDDKGNKTGESCIYWNHTNYVPDFKYLVKYRLRLKLSDNIATAETALTVDPGAPGFPYRLLSDRWQVPPDYATNDSVWYKSRNRAVSPSDYTPPAEWTRFNNALAKGQVPLVSVPHIYANFIFAADPVSLQQDRSNIDAFQKAGLLPKVNKLYSRIGTGWQTDLDTVQFLGFTVDQQTYMSWQTAMDDVLTFLANDRKSSLEIYFAKQSAVNAAGGIEKWADASKAYLSTPSVSLINIGGHDYQMMLPKNQFGLYCTVNDDLVSITGCRLRNPMPNGTESLINDFAYTDRFSFLQKVPFTPQAVFEGVSPKLVAVQGKPFPVPQLMMPDGNPYPVPQITANVRSILGLLLRDPNADSGLYRTDMTGFTFLRAGIKLSADRLKAVIDNQIGDSANRANQDFLWPQLICLVIALLIAFVIVIAIYSSSNFLLKAVTTIIIVIGACSIMWKVAEFLWHVLAG